MTLLCFVKSFCLSLLCWCLNLLFQSIIFVMIQRPRLFVSFSLRIAIALSALWFCFLSFDLTFAFSASCTSEGYWRKARLRRTPRRTRPGIRRIPMLRSVPPVRSSSSCESVFYNFSFIVLQFVQQRFYYFTVFITFLFSLFLKK